jgi:hypothetical protein
MPARVSLNFPEMNAAPAAWEALVLVLAGRRRPALDADSLKLVNLLMVAPCDVRLRPGRFELWRVARGGHHHYRSELAAPVVHHLMRRLGLARLEKACVGLLYRLGLGARFPECGARAVWLVPGRDEVEILVREAPEGPGPRVAVEAPLSGLWAVPQACPRPEPSWIRADRPCPHCQARPEVFRELPAQTALVCPQCGRSFDRRY